MSIIQFLFYYMATIRGAINRRIYRRLPFMYGQFVLILTGFFLFLPIQSFGQQQPFVSHPSQLDDDAYASWIIPLENEGVFYFRKSFEMLNMPEEFPVHVSADARYRLYVNGTLVSWGPAVGDTENWHYESVDIAPYLAQGDNVVAAQVWNWGSLNGARQQSIMTAFILQGDSPAQHMVNTDESWKVLKDPGYHVLAMTDAMVGGGFIAGGTDSLYAARHPWGWNMRDYDDSGWSFAKEIGKGNHMGLDTWLGTAWKLQARSIPFMEQAMERIAEVVMVSGVPEPDWTDQRLHVEIPAHSRVEILLDNRVLTMGFPQLLVAGGKDSRIEMRYQEALFGEDGRKGNRNDWEGKTMKGLYDVFIPDGGDRLFEPLWIRVFRYVKLTIDTGEEPLVIRDYYNLFTAYPLQERAIFSSHDETHDQIWEASWRTARLCALETYMDCPYYEQVQYIGDTRIQALISLYVDGDDRLARNALQQFYGSMQPMGLTKSAHPTRGVQIIPPFSLLFIAMVHDYYMMRDDPAFVRQFVPGIKFILEWFISRIDDTGMLGPLPYWNHIDGGTDFINGSPPGISDGGSAHMTLLLAYALDKATELLHAFDYPCDATRFSELSALLKEHTMKNCYSPDKGLVAETPAKQVFSQHTNIFAVLADAFSQASHADVMQLILDDKSLVQTTLYFKFYLFQALQKAGMGEKTIGLMDEWKAFLDAGFSTFPEHGIHSRSDCHAWSAHPMLAFLTIICGIESGAPGFSKVNIRPAPGDIEKLTGAVPHPLGMISVDYHRLDDGRMAYSIVLPEGLPGNLITSMQTYHLHPGWNYITE